MVEYIQNEKKCGRCKHTEGKIRPSTGVPVKFTHNDKTCDRCRERNHNWVIKNRALAYSSEFPIPAISVYAFKEGDEIVYIGSSKNAPARLRDHFYGVKNTAHSFMKNLNPLQRKKKYSWDVMWFGDSLDDARWNEKELIKLHQPKFNKTHKS